MPNWKMVDSDMVREIYVRAVSQEIVEAGSALNIEDMNAILDQALLAAEVYTDRILNPEGGEPS